MFDNYTVIRKETSYKSDINSSWNTFINTSWIQDYLIRQTAKHCERYLSDLFLTWKKIDRFLDQNEPLEKPMRVYFGIRESGVDDEAFIKARISDTISYGSRPYRAMYFVDVETDEKDITMTLCEINDDRYIEPHLAVTPIREEDRAEFIGQIIDTFEDYLEEKGIDIPNEEKEDDDDAAIIYGTDYSELQSDLEDILYNWNLADLDKTEEVDKLINKNTELLKDLSCFVKLLIVSEKDKTSSDEEKYKKINEACEVLKSL